MPAKLAEVKSQYFCLSGGKGVKELKGVMPAKLAEVKSQYFCLSGGKGVKELKGVMPGLTI